MKQDKKIRYRYLRTNLKIVGTIVPIVLLMIVIFFSLTRNEIVTLSKDKLALESKNYAGEISTWSEQILTELNVYRIVVEKMGMEDATYDVLRTSCGAHEAYPYGIYWGDENGNYFDSSDWEPGEDFVVTEREWYQEGLFHETFAFGEPYVDAMTGNACISVTSRLDCGSQKSVLSADVYFDYPQRLVNEITTGNIENAFFVTGDSRFIIADANASMVGAHMNEDGILSLYQSINELLDGERTGQSMVKDGRRTYFVDINKIGNTDWYFVTWISRGEVLKELRRIEGIMIVVATAAMVILVVLTLRFAREMGESRRKAKTDALTGLLNRYGFGERILMSLKASPGQGILLFMDIDNFKLVNDQLGHPVGDVVLSDFAVILEEYFNRNKDIVARIGGDEFAVFVGRPIGEAEAKEMLKKFIALFHNTFDGEYQKQQLSVSIGGVFVPEKCSYEELYRKADNALYEVKNK